MPFLVRIDVIGHCLVKSDRLYNLKIFLVLEMVR